MKTIGLNTLFLVPNQVGGTEYLTRAFVDALQTDTKHHYVLFCNRENADTFKIKSKFMKKVVCGVLASNRLARIAYEQMIFPFVVRQEQCNLLHSFGYTAPLISSCPQIVTIHDANWLDHAGDFSILARVTTNILVRGAMRSSEIIITDSQYSKQRLTHHFPSKRKKITVVLPILESKLFLPPFTSLPKILQGKSFALCVSAMYPHKRIPYLLELWKKIEASGQNLMLVLVGRHGKDESTVLQTIQEHDAVVYFPKVSFETLKSLYHYARVFVHPSIYEGFGLPVYEAYGAGLPILVGNVKLYENRLKSALRELTTDSQMDSHLISVTASESKKKNQSLWSEVESLDNLLQIYEKSL